MADTVEGSQCPCISTHRYRAGPNLGPRSPHQDFRKKKKKKKKEIEEQKESERKCKRQILSIQCKRENDLFFY